MNNNDDTRKFTFPKRERLTSRKTIQRLFSEGKSFAMPPLRVFYLPQPDPDISNHQLLFSVPKRAFKKAVDRNRVKRLMRESFRLNKKELEQITHPYCIGYIYMFNTLPAFELVQEKLRKSFKRLKKEIM